MPIFTSPGRSEFHPELTLAYDSGSGNGPFGLGWNLTTPAVSRKTEKGLPRYQDELETDIFQLTGAEDLVPALTLNNGSWTRQVTDRGEFEVLLYRPRLESLYARIERWRNKESGDIYWQMVSRNNITSIFGRNLQARVYDQANPSHVFKWYLEESFDDRGNIIQYEYKREDQHNLDPALPQETNRSYNSIYLKTIRYGNLRPFERADWLFQVIFDYGEHSRLNPTPDEVDAWLARPDRFSNFRPGFEVRTQRLCRRALVFHTFAELGTKPCLVWSTDFSYNENPVATLLTGLTQTGYSRDSETEPYRPKSYPPLEFSYTEARLESEIYFIEAADLENLPVGPNGKEYQWLDLDSEGLGGILTEQAGSWFYKRNLGEGHFGPVELVARRPSLAGLSSDHQQLLDLAGDGRRSLVLFTGPGSGYYERDLDDRNWWANFVPFKQNPNLDWKSPYLKFIDLTGDGLNDLLVEDGSGPRWHPSLGREGYGPAKVLAEPDSEDHQPVMVTLDNGQAVYLTDMTGDGLTDIVRIRNGEICYWPNLGYGRFGRKITMQAAPVFDYFGQFNSHQIRLADIDGSGTTDLFYFGNGQASYWINQAGNGWSEEISLAGFAPVDSLSSVGVYDLLGTGTGCLVWSSPLPGETGRSWRYLNLMGEGKPYLIKSIKNNLGAETRLSYRPSTWFYLQDRAAGNAWPTRLPFPVQVVEKVETRDNITGSKLVQSFSYHHGYFDSAEREFRGFGMVEERDTETFESYHSAGLFESGPASMEEDLFSPPVYTRTWFDTGAFRERPALFQKYATEYYGDDSQAKSLPGPVFSAGLSSRETIEACRALKGQMLRQEVYFQDNSTLVGHPYTVTEHSYRVELLQPGQGDTWASFHTFMAQTLEYHYERNPLDPRVNHRVNLEIDRFGNITSACALSYPRRPAQTKPDLLEQTRTLATLTQDDYINLDEPGGVYRIGLPAEKRTYELSGFASFGDWPYSIEQILGVTGAVLEIPYEAANRPEVPQKRLIERARTLYYNANLTGPATLGQSGSLALPYQTLTQAFTPGLLEDIFGGLVNPDLLAEEGGYRLIEGAWWQPGNTVSYDPARFYLPVSYRDPYGYSTQVEYDIYNLLVTATQDALQNRTTTRHNYRTLGPELVTDANLNRSQAVYDPLGMVTGTAVMGKEGENQGDILTGFEPDLDLATVLDHLGNPLLNPAAILGGATTRLIYDLEQYRRTRHSLPGGGEQGQPAVVYSLAREQHLADLAPGELPGFRHSFVYTDGFGRQVQTKLQAEPGLVEPGPSASSAPAIPGPRWVGSGTTVFNNKGSPVKQYEPFFSASPAYEPGRGGVTPVKHYDPLQRVYRVDFPDGTFSRVEFDPWQEVSWDQNDTVRESEWFARRSGGNPSITAPAEIRAATLAAGHAATPLVSHLDTLGRVFLTVADNGPLGQVSTRSELDIEGNQRGLTDPRGNRLLGQDFNMIGQVLRVQSAETGEKLILTNATGQPIRTVIGQEFSLRLVYDPLRRPTQFFVRNGRDSNTPEILAELTVWGESVPQAAALNLRGRPARHYDGAGVIINERHDFKGNLLSSHRRLAHAFRQPPDWSSLAGLTSLDELDQAGEPLLEAETFTSQTAYDALNRPVSLVSPDQSETRPSYNEAGLLEKVEAQLPANPGPTTFVSNVEYDAKGQRLRIEYGNGAQTRYNYDPFTFRLASLRTTRKADGSILQDLTYTYDPVGNIVEIQDKAQATVFFDNAMVPAGNRYEYDALYRLAKAEGRERADRDATAPYDQAEAEYLPIPHPANPQAVRRYLEQYDYDLAGNLTSLLHQGGADRWVRRYDYAATNNRLNSTSLPGDISPPYTARYSYDAQGNISRMPHLAALGWDHKAALREADLGGGGKVYFCYDSAGQRVRHVVERLGGMIEERIYLGGFELFRRRNGSGLALERKTLHILDNQRRVALVETTTTDTSDPVLSPVPVSHFQLGNHQESATLELDRVGAVIAYEEYYPFGASAYRAARSQVEVNPRRYRFTGQELDKDTGFYYHRARYYAPWLGRWVSPDPAGHVDGPNLYAYARNNPVNFNDPDGTQTGDPRETEFNPRFLPKPQALTDEPGPTFGKSLSIDFGPRNLKTKSFKTDDFDYDAPAPGLPKKPPEPKKERRFDEPTFLQSLVPVYGASKASLYHFEEGNYFRGTFFAGLAIFDVVTFGGLLVSGGKLVLKGLGRKALESDVIHLTSQTARQGILESQRLGGKYGINALEASQLPSSGLGRFYQTRVFGDLSNQIRITGEALQAFRAPKSIGPFSLYRYAGGERFTQLGSIELVGNIGKRFNPGEIFANGIFRAATQAELSTAARHQFLLNYGVDIGFYLLTSVRLGLNYTLFQQGK